MKKINHRLLDNLSEKAAKSKRKRQIQNFHTEASDTLQRMLNALESDTYCQPHRHSIVKKREAFIILKRKVAVIEFDNNGSISDSIILDSINGNYAVEIAPDTWHTILALENKTVVYELKDGPYDQDTDKEFAPWSPEEGNAKAMEYLEKLKNAIKN
jgi:cupin fold WbuC family metalloprotein